ncbi:MAG: hypothetical protein AB8F95_14680 [Bacteroidia bacterium]
MKYFPFEHITYRSTLDANTILNRLGENIEPVKTSKMTRIAKLAGSFGSNVHKPYSGSIHGMSFSIQRIINYRNSFLPKIEGELEEDLFGTTITVKMKPHLAILVFMSIWLGFVGLFLLAMVAVSIRKETFEIITLIPVFMLLFGYGLITFGFKHESLKSKKYLAELFEAEVVG